MKIYISITFLLLSVFAEGQVIVGKVMQENNNNVVSQAHIILSNNRATNSDNNGGFTIRLQNKEEKLTLHVSHLSYESYEGKIPQFESDTLVLIVRLKQKAFELKEFTTYNEKQPEQIFHSLDHYVHDFELSNDRLILITFGKSLKKDPRITLCSFSEILFD